MINSLKVSGQLISVTASGTINREDWQQVTETIRRSLAQHDSVSVFADSTHVDSMTPGAMYEDAKMGIDNLGSLEQFHRVAIVTASKWIDRAGQLTDRLLPGVTVKVFPGDDSAAHDWVTHT